MTNEDFVLGSILGGLGGYAFGKNPFKEWEPFIKDAGYKISRLEHDKIVKPNGFFSKVQYSPIWYQEGVRAYVYGLPNASMPLIFKCLEMGIKKKYEEIEKKSSSGLNSEKLIDWAEQFLRSDKSLAHSFRLIRNIIHQDLIVNEKDVPEAIRHISEMLNALFPYSNCIIEFNCMTCNLRQQMGINSSDNTIGNMIPAWCQRCGSRFKVRNFV